MIDVNKTIRLVYRLAVAQFRFFCQIVFGVFPYKDVYDFPPVKIFEFSSSHRATCFGRNSP